MPDPGFYGSNEFRAYPFIEQAKDTPVASGGPLALPDEVIVDFGCMVGPGSGYVDNSSKIWLERVFRFGDTARFVFRTTAVELLDRALFFDRKLPTASEAGDPEYACEFTWSVNAEETSDTSATAAEPHDCGQGPLWEGYLVTGKLDRLAEILDDGDEIVNDNTRYVVEPVTVQNMNGRYVLSLNIANSPRTRGFGPLDNPLDPDYPNTGIIHATCLTGPVFFQAGHNCLIKVSPSDNSIQFSASKGGGSGFPCAEIPLFDGETGPSGSGLLSGGPACADLITAINGLPGPDIPVRGGIGVRIETSPGKISVRLDGTGMADAGCTELG
jgi:hypothetical protein